VIEFQVLGRLEVIDGDRQLPLGGPQQRALLLVLLLNRGQPVAADRLVDALWEERAPATATKIVHGYVSSLRRALGGGLLVTRGHSYLLDVAPGQVDEDRFNSLLEQGKRAFREGDARHAAERFRAALALWRGPPLAEFAYQSFAQARIHRLEEARLTALEGRVDADLALGERAGLVPELEELVREHPLRERIIGQLMLALYRSGRQADALKVYRDARRRLVEELGLEPGSELNRLERRILEQDPALESPHRLPATELSRARLRRAGVLVAVGGALLLIALTALAVKLATRTTASLLAEPNTVAVIDPATNAVAAQVPVGAAPDGIAVDGGAVWVANTSDHTLSDINAKSRTVVRTLSPGGTVNGVAAGSGQLWAFNTADQGFASRLDPTFGTVMSRVKLSRFWGTFPASDTATAVGARSAWFADNAAAVVQVARDGSIVSTTDVGNQPSGIAIGAGSAWVADSTSDTVSRIEASGDLLATINVGRGASGIAVGGGAVWVADTLDNTLVKIDPGTDSVTTTIPVGADPRGVVWGDGSVWVANSGDDTVSRVDPATDRVDATITVGQSPQQLAFADHAVWVTVQARPAAVDTAPGSQPGVIRISRERPFPYLDPTRIGSADQDEMQMMYETCAGLLSYRDLPGSAGERLVPDAATALPNVSSDGRTYTFTIRKGLRFSPPSDAPVTAETFKHTIDRALSAQDEAYERGFFGDIVGEAAFNAGRTKRLAGVTARGNELQIRLTAPAPDLPARLAMLTFCAVPDDTPDIPQTQPIPAAGPYYIAASSSSQLVLKRNPNYHGGRPRLAREIIYSFGEQYADAVRSVAQGRSDYVSSVQLLLDASIPASLSARLARRYGPGSSLARAGHQQYFTDPTVTLDFFALNVKRHLFASTRVRQAVNYAIDRQAMVAVAGPYYGGLPTGHYLPPGMPGSLPDPVYPLGTPGLVRARALTRGLHATATMLTCNTAACIQTAQVVQSELRPIGIKVDIDSSPIDVMSTRMATSNSWDLGWETFSYDFADPSDYISGLFDPKLYGWSGGLGGLSSHWIAAIRRAFALTGEARLRTYGRLDDELALKDAPILAWATESARDFFSARIGCEIYQPIYGIDLGRLCTTKT
jgi:YVTN family beta-propeller protein